MNERRLSYSYFSTLQIAAADERPGDVTMSLRAILLIAVLLAGCQAIPTLRPYKMDIQQGNVITPEMLARLQPGMTRSQVRFTLGTPMVVDPFRADRWDYVYLYSKRGELTEQRRIMVVFKDDKLVRIEGDAAPAGTGAGAKEQRALPARDARAAQQTER
jgi:outer membrane protein assembly factor BamE